MPLRALGIMMFCNIVWALNVVVSKIAVADYGTPPLFYALLRSVLVAAVLLPLLRPLPARLWQVLVIGLAISGGSFALLFMGLATASPSAAATPPTDFQASAFEFFWGYQVISSVFLGYPTRLGFY